MTADIIPFEQAAEPAEKEPVVLKKLGPKHKQAMSLLAQGLGRQDIAAMCEWTPEYITWLARQPLCIAYLAEMSQYVDARYVAMADQTADVIAGALRSGSEKAQLQAAKLQLEITHKIGPERSPPKGADDGNRLEVLADRLLKLLEERQPPPIAGEYTEFVEAKK